MRILLLLIGFASMANGLVAAAADDRKFPYEAIVDAEDGENVRSGPGPRRKTRSSTARGRCHSWLYMTRLPSESKST